LRQLAQFSDARFGAFAGIMRMDADRGVNSGVTFRQFDGQAVVFDTADGADRDQGPDPRTRCPFDNLIGIISQPYVSQMTMAIRDVQGRIQALVRSIRGNSATGDFTL
jgi:hypothetical protein